MYDIEIIINGKPSFRSSFVNKAKAIDECMDFLMSQDFKKVDDVELANRYLEEQDQDVRDEMREELEDRNLRPCSFCQRVRGVHVDYGETDEWCDECEQSYKDNQGEE